MSEKTTTRSFVPGERNPRFALAMFSWDEFQKFWPGIEEMLDSVPHTWRCWTKEHIVSGVENGYIQVWGIGPAPDAILIFFTQVATYPAYKVLTVPWGAGHFQPEMLPTIQAALTHYAQMQECELIEVRGRPGWDPHFKKAGMKKEYVTWSIPVSNSKVH